ncbi:MAG: Vms1/Ankzf1 family peptidyl-tRNA hydrolase [Anaerolineae bacterium]
MLTRQEVDKLSHYRSEKYPVMSLYLNIDTGSPDQERSQIRLKNLFFQVEDTKSHMTTEEAESLSRDQERIRAFVREQAMQGARGVAVFASSGAGLWETFTFPNRIGQHIEIGDAPYVKPLFRMLERYKPVCTVLVGKGKSRIFLLYGDEIVEQTDVFSPVPGRHDQGGWSQARLQRHHGERVIQHLKATADRLFKMYQGGVYRRLLIGGTDELVTQFQAYLHPYLQDRVVDTFPMEMMANVKKIQQQSLQALDASEQTTQQLLLERLESEFGAQKLGVASLTGTIRALQRGQIMTLLVNDGFAEPGYRCVSCGHIILREEDQCPYCSGELEHIDDVVALIIDQMYEQGSDVVFVAGDSNTERLAKLGNIGALLRYQFQP